MTAYFTVCATLKAIQLTAMFDAMDGSPRSLIDLAAGVASLGFLLLIVVTTVRRLPPKRSAEGIQPRVVALLGSFATVTLIVLPVVEISPAIRLIADLLTIVGFSLCIWCLWWLGRSFSIMAQARRLVTSGPYRLVRHPLYACEAVALAGIILSNPSWGALAIASMALGFQYLRIRNEESVLRTAFPEYAAYAEQVPMLLPRLKAPRPALQN
ncbi:methyltransferase family protein [Mesorhizobium sp. L-8-10]|uniref:methyltransferase family protein n=1 Tax=Mesorhizobium sp. L-8-10 TaxID=2744523 RepID=UPI0019282FDE|nr:isoprenylcysteine carboxylmethyltransferase family protein [Mesorhizobium sp. L-8-10]